MKKYLNLVKTGVWVLRHRGPRALVQETVRYFRWVRHGAPQEQPAEDTYHAWLERHRLSEEDLEVLARDLAYKPLISIIMPVHDPAETWLRRAIESVERQAYPFWELCITDDASTQDYVPRVLEEYARQDPRIKVKRLERNLNIAGASNEALALAAGEFVAFLDHDDELAPEALLEVARALNADPSLDIFYSDEDKITPEGQRVEPYFKPGWSPDLLLSCMYMTHLRVYRRSLVQQVGGHRPGYDGSQDYDLLLLLTEVSSRIHHIPSVLYHWRKVPSSAASGFTAKPFAYEAAKRSLADALARRGVEASVEDGMWTGSYRIRYAIKGQPLVSVIIATKDKVQLLARCIESIRGKTVYKNYEILVVDNGSSEPRTKRYLEKLAQRPGFRVLDYPRPFNFSSICNFGARHASGQHFLFLNNDTEVLSEDWMSALLEHSQRPEVGAVGAKLLFPNRTVQHAGVVLGLGPHRVAGHPFYKMPDGHGYFGLVNIVRNCSAVTAACAMFRREVFEEVKGFDEVLGEAYQDIDLCLRIRERGYLVVYTPYAPLLHHESTTMGKQTDGRSPSAKDVATMRRRWGPVLDHDTYDHPTLISWPF